MYWITLNDHDVKVYSKKVPMATNYIEVSRDAIVLLTANDVPQDASRDPAGLIYRAYSIL